MVLIDFYGATEDLTKGRIVRSDFLIECPLVKGHRYFQCFPGGNGEYRGLPWLSWDKLHGV